MVWFQKQWKMAKFAPEFAPVNFPKNGLAPAHFPNLVKFNRVYSGGLALDMLSVRFPSAAVGGVKKIGRLKMFLFPFPTAGGVKKNWNFFQNVPGSIPNCGATPKPKTPPPLVPPRTFIHY